MASIDRPSTGVPVAQMRALLERFWRRIAAQRPAVRWGLGRPCCSRSARRATGPRGRCRLRACAISLRASGFPPTTSSRWPAPSTSSASFIGSTTRSEWKLRRDQFEQAAEVVAKLDLGQRPIDEIRDEVGLISLWDGLGEREQKDKLKLERMLERLISEQDGVLCAVVSINRPRPSTFARNSAKPSAFVYVETDAGRSLASRSVQAILVAP